MDKLLKQRYQLQSLLNRQTGRRTFLANDLQTDRQVVIKLVLLGTDFQWQDLKLFEREAKVLKTLAHPAIPQYIDFFELDIASGKGFALVQTYIEAKSLQTLVTAGYRFGEPHLQEIAQSLLTTLDYLHSCTPAVIHRDLKPSNVLLSGGSHNKPAQISLIDFGAVQTTRHDGTMTVVGTYGYMPPEQFGGKAQPASDLYALGATLIYLATGEHPSDLLQDNFQIAFEAHTTLSPAFSNWLKQLTCVQLSQRTRTAAQALKALSELDSISSAPLTSQPNAAITLTSHADFRAAAERRARQDYQLYISADTFEIDCPLHCVKKVGAFPFPTPPFNFKFLYGLLFGSLASSLLNPTAFYLFLAGTCFGTCLTPLQLSLRTCQSRVSLRLSPGEYDNLLLRVTAPLSPDLSHPQPVPEMSELNALQMQPAHIRSISARVRTAPYLNLLTFELIPSTYEPARQLTILASHRQIRWLSQYLKQWHNLSDINLNKSWTIRF